MILKVSLICFVTTAMAAETTKPDAYYEIYNAIQNVHRFVIGLSMNDLFLNNYKQTLPLFEKPPINVSVSNVWVRNVHKNSTYTQGDLFGTCLYGKHFELSLPSRTKNTIEFFGDIKETNNRSQLNEKIGTFAVTYNGIKFHLKAENETHIDKIVKFENSEDRFDFHSDLPDQYDTKEFKKQILEPMIHEKFAEWIDGSQPLQSIVSHCFNRLRRPQSSIAPYQIPIPNYTVSISGLSDLQKVFFVNDGSSEKIELYTSSLNCTINETNGRTVRCGGLRMYGESNIQNGIASTPNLNGGISLKDCDIIGKSTTPESALFDGKTVRAIRNDIQESINRSI